MKKVITSILLSILFFVGAVSVNAQTLSNEEQITRLLQQIQILQNLIASIKAGNTSVSLGCSPIVSQTLTRGSSGIEVQNVHKFLMNEGYYNGGIDDPFGLFSEIAVQRYQTAKGIVSSGSPESTGFGLVGPKTRAQINQDVCNNSNEDDDNDSNSGDVQLSISINDDDFVPGETIYVEGVLKNNSNKTISYDQCDGFEIEVDGVEEENGSYNFCYSLQDTINPGQTKKFNDSFTISNDFDEDGRYNLVANFPGGYKKTERIRINVEDDNDDSDDELDGDVKTSIFLNDDDFRAGETVVITATLKNETNTTIPLSSNGCDIDVDIKGVPEELSSSSSCDGYSGSSGSYSYSYDYSYSYGSSGIAPGQTKTWTYRYKIPSSFTGNTNYTVRVEFPNGDVVTEGIFIGDNDPDYSLSIVTNKSSYNQKETIYVTATLKNESNDEIELFSTEHNVGCKYLAVYLSDSIEEEDTPDCSESTFRIATLDPNESATIKGEFIIPDLDITENKTVKVYGQFGTNIAEKSITILK